jgi:hypothetical protein
MMFRETVAVYCENHTEHTNTLFEQNAETLYIRIQFVPHRKHIFATKPNRLMLFGETVAVCCENHTEHINKLCGQNVVFHCYRILYICVGFEILTPVVMKSSVVWDIWLPLYFQESMVLGGNPPEKTRYSCLSNVRDLLPVTPSTGSKSTHSVCPHWRVT